MKKQTATAAPAAKQPAVALAFNRQHTRGTAPTHLQPADITPHQQAASWEVLLERAIPKHVESMHAVDVLNTVVTFIQQRRWQDLASLASCADYITKTTPEQRNRDYRS